MIAAVLHGREDIRIEEVPERALAAGEIRVEIGAALTCGTDLKVYKRGYHAKMITPPAVFGHEMAGVVSETGAGVTKWKTGDRVVVANSAPCGECRFCRAGRENLCDDLLFLNGAYARSIVVPARVVAQNTWPLAPATAFRDAALTEPLACVVQGMDDLKVSGGEKALVIGSGPIGLMFVALLAHAGCEVHLAGRGEQRLETGRRLGALKALETPREGITKDFYRERGFADYDLIVEAVGKPETWEIAPWLLVKGGRVNLFGGCPTGTTCHLDTHLIHYSGLTLLASFHHRPDTIRRALHYVESGVIHSRDFVTDSTPLSELPQVFQEMAAGNRAVKTFVDPTR